MTVEENLNEIKKAIKDHIPPTALITKVDFEGPEVVLYSKNPSALANGEVVKELARVIRKRIVIRADSSVLMEPGSAIEKIKQIVPQEAGIIDIKFDPNFGEAIIESAKPGLVIGKAGTTLANIKQAIGWTPVVRRDPPITSKIVKSIRAMLLKTSDERKEILRKIGRRIHRTPLARGTYWIRMSAMGGFREVGRTALYLHTPESKVLIDCGVNIAASDENAYPSLNLPEFNLQELDAVVVTHAHLDHCGFVPYLFYMGYEGPVYCTPPTRDLMFLLQWDYLDVVEREGKNPPYPRKFIKKLLKHVIPLEYGEVTDIAPDIRLTLHNSGHILGASIAHFHIGDGLYNLAYTGDLKFQRSRLFEAANFQFPRLETLIIESTYGSGEPFPPRIDSERELIKHINATTERGGRVLMPVFAVGRAQELIVVMDEYMSVQKALNPVPVYLDGMIWEATGIHTTYPEYLNRDLRDEIFHKGHNPFLAPIFHRVTGSVMRKEVIGGGPCIVLATSGMLSGGPSIEYFKNWASDARNSIIFVGYQSEGSLGRRIQKGWREITMNEDGKTRAIPVNMSVHTVEGFSGHSDRNELINYVKRINPKPEKVITCHGEEKRCTELASTLYKIFRCETRAPQNLEVFRVK